MSAPIVLPFGVRKVVRYVEDTYVDGAPGGPVRMLGVAAVLPNPWAGRGFVENLRPEILAIAPVLADILVPAVLDLCGGGERVEAYGKAALVGVNGELEHASALIHTLRFGNACQCHALAGTGCERTQPAELRSRHRRGGCEPRHACRQL